MDELGKDHADDRSDPELVQREMVLEHAMNAGDELRKRRSSRIVQAVPLTVTGVDALGRPFVERTSSLIINCHGCRYQSKHYVLKNMWVMLEIPHAETGQAPRQVRGRVAWIQRPRTVRQLFQVALELELPGNVWGIGFPPEDWAGFPAQTTAKAIGVVNEQESASQLVPAAEKEHEHRAHAAEPEMPPPAVGAESLSLVPPPVSTTDASLQLARQVARLIADAKQQISAAAREAAALAVAQEHRTVSQQLEKKASDGTTALRSEADRALDRIQREGEQRARTLQEAAAKALQQELPKWLKPHLEHLTREVTAEFSKQGAKQRELQEQQANAVSERVKQLCREAEDVARRIVAQAQEAERRITEQASVNSAVMDSKARRQEETFATLHERLNATAGAAQQKLTDAAESVHSELQSRVAGQLDSAREQLQQMLDAAVAKMHESAAESTQQSVAAAHAQIQELLSGEFEQRIAKLRETVNTLVAETEQRLAGGHTKLRGELEEQSSRIEQVLARVGAASGELEQFSSRLGTTQQLAVEGFQAQLDDVLTLHRNEMHRRSEVLFEELNARVRQAFDHASRDAVSNFDQQVRELAEPHIARADEAINRMAGGRSLLDAALSLHQDRIRAAADEAFAEALGRFRENLGGVEQVLNDASQAVITRNLAELETRVDDLQHRTSEEIYKTAEWYEKKAQTQLQGLSEKLVETGGQQLREKAGEVSAEFAAELDHSSRGFVGHTQNQMKEVVRESFDRARELFAEAADTTTAAFTDEIQRTARRELDGFTEVVNQTANESTKQFADTQERLSQHLTAEQESFLQRFQTRMAGALEQGIHEAQQKINEGFAPLMDSFQDIAREQHNQMQEKIRESLASLSSDATGEFKTRLENVSNAWLLATVAKLDHQSRDVVSGISASAQERLRAACADVFSNVGESLRKRLQEITAEFGKSAAEPSA